MALEQPDKFMERLRSGFSLSAVIKGRNTPDGKRVRGLGTRKGFSDPLREISQMGPRGASFGRDERSGRAEAKRRWSCRSHSL
jgi:hypothetical protein